MWLQTESRSHVSPSQPPSQSPTPLSGAGKMPSERIWIKYGHGQGRLCERLKVEGLRGVLAPTPPTLVRTWRSGTAGGGCGSVGEVGLALVSSVSPARSRLKPEQLQPSELEPTPSRGRK